MAEKAAKKVFLANDIKKSSAVENTESLELLLKIRKHILTQSFKHFVPKLEREFLTMLTEQKRPQLGIAQNLRQSKNIRH